MERRRKSEKKQISKKGIIGIGAGISIILMSIYKGCLYLFKMGVVRDGNIAMDHPEKHACGTYANLQKKLEKGRVWLEQQPLETHVLQSEDGLKLQGYYLKNPKSVRTVFCIHGYRGNGKKDLSCLARFYYENHCSVFLVDQRAHGESEGQHITFGVKEKQDCFTWLHYLVQEKQVQEPIFVHGVSMGATTALLMSNMSLPQNVKGIIADCGYTAPWDILKHIIKNNFKFPVFPTLHIVNAQCKYYAKFSLKGYSTANILKHAKVPVLFIHGTKDTFVPICMTVKNYRSCTSQKKLVLIKDAGHGLCYLLGEDEFQKELHLFFKRCV